MRYNKRNHSFDSAAEEMKDGLIEHDSDIDEDHLKMRENLLNSKRKTSNILEPPNSANNNMKSNMTAIPHKYFFSLHFPEILK